MVALLIKTRIRNTRAKKNNFSRASFFSGKKFFLTPLYISLYKKKYNRRFYQTDTIFVRVISLFFDSFHPYYSLFHEKTAIPRYRG